jgi:hypothetical protein
MSDKGLEVTIITGASHGIGASLVTAGMPHIGRQLGLRVRLAWVRDLPGSHKALLCLWMRQRALFASPVPGGLPAGSMTRRRA